MTTAQKGLLVGAVHLAIVASLGAELLVERLTRPRVWVRTAPYDPALPIRGRYVQLRIEAEPSPQLPRDTPGPVAFAVQNGRLMATPDARGESVRLATRQGAPVVVPYQGLAFFLPETMADPSRRATGEELWVEVTVPRRGLPRPIRLGVKRDGVLRPLE